MFLPDAFDPRDRLELDRLLADHNPDKASRRFVSKATVLDRVEAAGLGDRATDLLMANKRLFRRWTLPGRLDVETDDPAVIAFIGAMGLNPAVILAPEA